MLAVVVAPTVMIDLRMVITWFIKDQGVVDLNEERKAAMVSNLLVVLCGDEPAQPVVNSGSL